MPRSCRGAIAPVTIRWVLDGVPVPSANDQPVLDLPCNPDRKITSIKVTVSDPTGSANAIRTGKCAGPIG